jgi:hypothetical protein
MREHDRQLCRVGISLNHAAVGLSWSVCLQILFSTVCFTSRRRKVSHRKAESTLDFLISVLLIYVSRQPEPMISPFRDSLYILRFRHPVPTCKIPTLIYRSDMETKQAKSSKGMKRLEKMLRAFKTGPRKLARALTGTTSKSRNSAKGLSHVNLNAAEQTVAPSSLKETER